MMTNARKITSVDLTIAEVNWVSILNLTAATVKKKIFAHLKIAVERIKVIVIQMKIVWMDLSVDWTTAQIHLIMILKLIAAIILLLEIMIFVQLIILVE